MNMYGWKSPKGLYLCCCNTIVAMAIIPPVVVLSFGALSTKIPDAVQEMWAFPYYKPMMLQDGMVGVDLYQRFLSASAMADGFSPYKDVPAKYMYSGQNVPFYPPSTYWLYSTLIPLGYRTVFFIHSVVKIAVFLVAVSWVFWVCGEKYLLFPTLLAVFSCILFTPIGQSEILQGQFEFFVAAACTLVYAMLFCHRKAWVLVAGILASIKISSLVFIAPFFLVAFVSNRKRSRGLVGVFAVMLGILALFFPYLIDFIRHIIAHEFVQTGLYSDRTPVANGISFTQVLPYYVGKGIIFACTATVLVVLFCVRDSDRRAEVFLAASFPFAVMLMLQGAGFGVRAWAYKGVTLLALLPGLYLWLKAGLVPAWFQRFVTGLFTFLIASLLLLYPVRQLVLFHSPENLVWVYLFASGIFFALTLVAILLRFGRGSFQISG